MTSREVNLLEFLTGLSPCDFLSCTVVRVSKTPSCISRGAYETEQVNTIQFNAAFHISQLCIQLATSSWEVHLSHRIPICTFYTRVRH